MQGIAISMVRNRRGVALLIVLLVTALLIALIFEFAYGTRVSLRAAVNFRDSQRAYFLARSGVKVFMKYKELQESVPQGEWTVVPMVSAGDAELRMRWEDEGGKINIKPYLTTDDDTAGWLEELFSAAGVSQGVLDALREEFKGKPVQLPGELRRVMSDEAYGKVGRFMTVYSGQKRVNVNTASDEVLRCMGIEPALIAPSRPIQERGLIPDPGVKTRKGSSVKDFLDVTSAVFQVSSHATVGEYTMQVEAVVDRGSGRTLYWRSW